MQTDSLTGKVTTLEEVSIDFHGVWSLRSLDPISLDRGILKPSALKILAITLS